MTIHRSLSRRGFLQGSAALAASIPVLGYALPAQYDTLQGRFYKTLKIGMVKVNGSLVDKFRAAKDCGFDGIELSAPGFDIAEVNQAIKEVDFPVDGTVCAGHWGVRHTDPDPAVRAEALENSETGITGYSRHRRAYGSIGCWTWKRRNPRGVLGSFR